MLVRLRPAAPDDVDFLIQTYEVSYGGGYSACFDRYGAVDPEDVWWVQSEKSVFIIEIDRAPGGLLILGKDRAQLLVEELLLVRRGGAVPRIYDEIAGQFKHARQDRILLRAAESNAAALSLADAFEFTFVNALVVASGASRQDAVPPPGYSIRRAASEDARQVARLTDDLGMPVSRPRRSTTKKDQPHAVVWIAERDRYPAGVAEARLRDGVGWWTVAVREGHRGKGIGTALAAAALEFCRSRRVKPVTLYWALDPGAGRMAQRVGATSERTYLYLGKKL